MVTRPNPPSPPARDSISVELGDWFKAHATGAGVIAIPFVVIAILAAALARWFL